MTDFFFYGTLCHPPLLEAVLGRKAAPEPARLPDHAVHWAEGQAFPLILPRPGAVAEGVALRGLSDADVARLDFYEGGFGYLTQEVALEGGAARARVYVPEPGRWTPGAPWRLRDWAGRYGAVAVAAAADFMAAFGRRPAAEVCARYPMLLVRAASRLRAARPAPASLRHAARPGDVVVERREEPYARFFAAEDYRLRHHRFDGGTETVARTAFVTGDAATVLPYDPARDRVLVVEQFRTGPFARGDANPWQIEPVAGRIDAHETPEEAVRREAREEAGLDLGALLPVASYYPTPGAVTEFLYSFVGLADLPDGIAGLGGVESEAEDIRSHLIPFARLMDLVASGEGGNAPLILSAFWLAANRERLRQGAIQAE